MQVVFVPYLYLFFISGQMCIDTNPKCTARHYTNPGRQLLAMFVVAAALLGLMNLCQVLKAVFLLDVQVTATFNMKAIPTKCSLSNTFFSLQKYQVVSGIGAIKVKCPEKYVKKRHGYFAKTWRLRRIN